MIEGSLPTIHSLGEAPSGTPVQEASMPCSQAQCMATENGQKATREKIRFLAQTLLACQDGFNATSIDNMTLKELLGD